MAIKNTFNGSLDVDDLLKSMEDMVNSLDFSNMSEEEVKKMVDINMNMNNNQVNNDNNKEDKDKVVEE